MHLYSIILFLSLYISFSVPRICLSRYDGWVLYFEGKLSNHDQAPIHRARYKPQIIIIRYYIALLNKVRDIHFYITFVLVLWWDCWKIFNSVFTWTSKSKINDLENQVIPNKKKQPKNNYLENTELKFAWYDSRFIFW